MKALLGDRPPPFQHASDTSKAAAKSIAPLVGTLQARVLDCIKASGFVGRTNEEISEHLNTRIQSICGRVRELTVMGCIKDSERRRPTRTGRKATVWVAT